MENTVYIYIKTRYQEADMQGVIHNSVYLIYYDEVRMAYIDKYIPEYDEKIARLMVHTISNKYIKPIYPREEIKLSISLKLQTSVRSQFEINIYNKEGELVHTAIQDMVWTDSKGNLINIQKEMPTLYQKLKDLEVNCDNE